MSALGESGHALQRDRKTCSKPAAYRSEADVSLLICERSASDPKPALEKPNLPFLQQSVYDPMRTISTSQN